MDNTLSVLRARQQFLAHGHMPQGAVNEVIERSWRRCRDNGINSTSPLGNGLMGQHELAQRLQKNQLLLSHAQPEMAILNEQIANTHSTLVLSDNEGVILHSLGDYFNRAHQLVSSPGFSWSEGVCGTNAVGTALVERAAIVVHGAEHFMEHHHILSCSAVPIFDADNVLLGTLDVTNDSRVAQQHTLALVKMSAQIIENRLFRASHHGDLCVYFHARPEFIGTLWEGIAMFSHDGELLATNRSGRFQLGLQGRPCLHFDDLFALPLGAVLGMGHDERSVFPLQISNGARVYCRLHSTPPAAMPTQRKPAMAPRQVPHLDPLGKLDTGDRQVSLAIQQARLVLDQDIAILIQGETGVGKELFAQALHQSSKRSHGPFVAVNCAALPEGLIEAELFGYEEGAFTGARRKGGMGKLEQANGGTLFLDEIGDMPLSLQARLLRVLQERSVTPLGSNRSRPLHFALVSATNQHLPQHVEAGSFRRDLYYRLNGISLNLPPLRQRGDLEALVALILKDTPVTSVSDAVMQRLRSHDWPGNIRQLYNLLRTALALSGGARIEVQHLTQDFLQPAVRAVAPEQQASSIGSLGELSSALIRQAVLQQGGNMSAAARQLGISRNTLYRKLKQLGLA